MQYSLSVVIAAGRTIVDGSAEGHVWLVYPRDESAPDLERVEGGPDPALTFPCTGVHFADGSMADDVTLNWMVSSVTSIPQGRPVPVPLTPDQAELADRIRELVSSATSLQGQEDILAASFNPQHRPLGDTRLPDAPGTPRDIDGRPITVFQALTGAYLVPILADITGPAVDDGVIYPAQYGSPDALTEGWYWSATVDTAKPGIHEVILHVDIFRPAVRDGVLTFRPVRFQIPTWLDVRAVPAVNGFTGAGLGYLPLPWEAPAAAPAAATHEGEAHA